MVMRDIVIEKLTKAWQVKGASEEYNDDMYKLGLKYYYEMSDEDLLWELEHDAYERGCNDSIRY